jgi:CheY-like chemotaxis protein
MDGTIEVESAEGLGSTFTARLRLERDPTVVPAEPTPALRRVLVVEDAASVRRILCAVLEQQGCQAEGVGDVASALTRLRAARVAGRLPDAVLLDLELPGTDAAEALRGLHALEPGLVVIGMTSVAQLRAARALLSLGLRGPLAKPVKPERLRAALTGADEPAATAARTVRGPGARVLLVEDNQVNRRLARRILERAGHSVRTATNGIEALEAAAEEAFEAVLMDCQMPVMDGFSAARILRQRERAAGTPPVPILALTAHARESDRERCLEAGMDDVLCKPFEPEQLLAALEACRARRRAVGA